MALEIKEVEYFNFTINSGAEEIYMLLSKFAEVGVSLYAFKAIPFGQNQTKLSLFPNNSSKMKDAARKAVLNLDGPHAAIIIKSNSDEPGECAGIFQKLSKGGINVHESIGIADIYGGYGVVLYMKKENCEKAISALKA